jgi:hypothetical protein
MKASISSEARGRTRTEDDPLRLCIYTTVALLAWVLTPPLVVALFGGLGAFAYIRARREGLRRSRCWLRDTRLVIAYLGAAFLAGAAVVVLDVVRYLA